MQASWRVPLLAPIHFGGGAPAGGVGPVLLVCTLLGGCVVEPPPEREPDFVLETERLTIMGYGRSEDELCGGTVAWMDDYVDSLAPYYGLAAGEQLGVYKWYSDELWDELAPCPPGALGCVRPSEPNAARAPIIPLEHEIVHLFKTDCIRVLEEGLAEYLRGTIPVTDGSIESADIEHTFAGSFDGGSWNWSDYHRSRNFVSFLAQTYGLETVIDLCDATPRGIARADFDTATRELLGVGLDALLAAYADYPECPEWNDRAKLLECSREPLFEIGRWGDQGVDVTPSCDDSEAVGTSTDRFRVIYPIRIVEDGEYNVSMEVWGEIGALTGAVLRFEQCASCGEGAKGYTYTWDSNYVVFSDFYEAGNYVVELQLPGDFSSTVELSIFGK